MRTVYLLLLAGLFAMASSCTNALAATSVRVVDAWPQGADVVLGRNQNYYLRLAYATDRPVHIWARPYFHGQPAQAGSNPSREYNGSGEAFGWFFLARPDAQVDEVRITAGDGSPADTPQVADLRVRVSGSERTGARSDEPAWVGSMKTAEAQAERADYQARMNAPIRPGEGLLFAGFMLLVCATGLFSLGMPAWALWKWRGGWRLAAVVPAAVMAFVMLRIMVDTARDPTSHNLWPFEVLVAGLPCAVVLLVMVMLRRARLRRA
ncbi:MAG TPA: hypothetical protein VGH80_00265 [Xanthomonadaceae bacterium]|jgi:hypothetical protein